jgi:hypothetical protein
MRKLSLLFALVTTAAGSASAQLVSVGALGGVRLTDGLSYGDESRPYVVGGSVEIRLPARFAIEADALYQRVGDTTSFYYILAGATSTTLASENPASITRERGNSWQFPLYVKYYFRPNTAVWQPFIGTGYAFRTISFHTEGTTFSSSDLGTSTSTFHGDFRSGLSVGASIVAGLRFHYGPVAFLPQVRYTRWGDSSNSLNKNEATLLLGVSF